MRHRKTIIVCVAGMLAIASFGSQSGRAAFALWSTAPAKTFDYAGCVVDEAGHPIAGVQVTATHRELNGRGFGYIDVVKSDAAGNFAIHQSRAQSGATPDLVEGKTIRLEFSHPGFAFGKLEDMHLFKPEQATQLNVILHEGESITGQVIDGNQHPVAGALVEINFDQEVDQRRGTLSDARGFFHFHGLPSEKGTLDVLTTNTDQPAMTLHQSVATNDKNIGVVIVAPVTLPAGTVTHELFGMKLIDVDKAIQDDFHLSHPDGVMILDPGSQSDHLDIGELKRGDQFWIVGDKAVKNFAELKTTLRAACQPPVAPTGCRIVYCFSRADFTGTNTQNIKLNKTDLAELQQ